MPTVKLTAGYSPIPEGPQVFKITDVTYKEEFGKCEIKMVTAKGRQHTERYQFMRADHTPNEGALNAFSFLVRCAMPGYDADEIDPSKLVGHYFRANVVHDVLPSTKKEGETVTFIRLTDKSAADGFDEPEVAPKPKKTVPVPQVEEEEPAPVKKKYDLSSLLG